MADEKPKKEKKPIQILKEKYPVPAELMDGMKETKQIWKAIKTALKDGPGSPPEIAERCGYPVKDVFFHLVSMVKYHEITFVKEDYAEYFEYMLKED